MIPMKRLVAIVTVLATVAVAFAVGRWAGERQRPPAATGRPVLYWVDPMNPSFRSPQPGIAPCGMPLEPVYADLTGAAPTSDRIVVARSRRSLVGIETQAVSSGPVAASLRLFGRVAADESRVHVITSKLDGSVQRVGAAAKGSLVQPGELLGEFTSDTTAVSQRTLLTALEEIDELKAEGLETDPRMVQFKSSARVARQNLLNLGLTENQVEEIARTRRAATFIEVRSPVAGYVLERNFALGQRFESDAPLFVIADIRRVWIWADVFGADATLLRPGAAAVVRLPDRPGEFEATISRASPRFDPVARTQAVRLNAVNSAGGLLPGMFVDVEVPITAESAMTVPAEAVVDTGLRRRVWVDRGDDGFEAREVRTGFKLGDRVQVLSGLVPGDEVVVAGNFLLDSESRLRTSRESTRPTSGSPDPVCGMRVDPEMATASGLISDLAGQRYSFCSPRCKERFDADSSEFVESGVSP